MCFSSQKLYILIISLQCLGSQDEFGQDDELTELHVVCVNKPKQTNITAMARRQGGPENVFCEV